MRTHFEHLHNGLIPQLGPSYEQIAADPQFAEDVKNLTAEQKKRINKNADYTTSGNGYFVEHSTRVSLIHNLLGCPSTNDPPQPATIGLALYDNPIGQLVSIYYLTGTFETAGNTYYQNPAGFSTNLLHAKTNVPMGFASYYFDIAYYPPFYVAKVGNLVYNAGKMDLRPVMNHWPNMFTHSDHPRGGHFTGLDNPDALIGYFRKMMGQWYYA
ncbi:hypothetical protein AG1IA_09864 [Rhizoctonia solani AG-1 IA]|uniref:Uncharacterized protein n=1 Tax=Thanatephorus cucumeris (strain AG1-IA) TaxID=983506 RepID=L8WD48_THACA|nr:hypothetical protein AG1IA_09864 [Rhizoctonia solani AG-1 IA]